MKITPVRLTAHQYEYRILRSLSKLDAHRAPGPRIRVLTSDNSLFGRDCRQRTRVTFLTVIRRPACRRHR